MRVSELAAEVHRAVPAPHVGVPDSLLKDYLHEVKQLTGQAPKVAPNEGAAVAFAIGHFLGTGAPAVVFLQNSGLGNALNPLMSLAHKSVYGVPMLLIVGWRGAPDFPDEPQHVAQGAATFDLVSTSGFALLEVNRDTTRTELREFLDVNVHGDNPTFLLIRPDGLSPSEPNSHAEESAASDGVDPDDAIRHVLRRANSDSSIVATTGYTARQVEYIYRREFPSLQRPFLSLGGMGHASAIALGLASNQGQGTRPWRVICIDGDGSMQMHLGTMGWAAAMRPAGLVHVILTNGRHESVGAQPVANPGLDFAAVARACGCQNVLTADNLQELETALDSITEPEAHATVIVRTRLRGPTVFPRPSETPREMITEFMSPSRIEN